MNPIHPLWLVAIAWASSICAVPAMAQPAQVQPALQGHSAITAPATHQQVSQRSVSVDGVSASLTRHERRDGRNTGLGGEHFSTLIAADGTLKGFVHLSLDVATDRKFNRMRPSMARVLGLETRSAKEG